jgi:HSP20 family protein
MLWTTQNPWGDFRRLQDEINELFSWTTTPYAGAAEFPRMNVWLGEEEATLVAEVPGVDPKEIDLSVTGEALTIKGKRSTYELHKNEAYHRRERNHGTFTRTVTLPFRADADKIDAKFDNGLLTIKVPRAVADRPKKIAVKG